MKIRNNGSRIFLTELIFAIFFFIVIAAVCVQCFATSYSMSKAASEKTQAVNAATNAAELFVGYLGAEDFTKYYDSNWCELHEESDEACYRVTGIITDDELVSAMNITVSKMADDSIIYSLNVEKPNVYLED